MKTLNTMFRVAPLASALLLACLAPAHAAPAPEPDPDPMPRELDRVTVNGHRESYGAQATRTATKTDAALRDVPQAVTVITEEAIRDLGMTSMVDTLRFVPGVGVAQGEGHRDAPIFRGNISTSDMFVDGVRDDVQYIRDLYNIDRVEVLKGPNAMIFGRGGVGGVINRVTKVADGHTHREIGLQFGSFDRARATFDLGQATGSAASVRVTGLYEDSGSFRDGFDLERYGINPTLTFGFGDATTLTLGYEYFRDERVADRGIPSLLGIGIGRPADLPRETFVGDPERSPIRASVSAFTALLEHDFSDRLTLRNRTRYADYDRYYRNVYPNGVANSPDGLQAVIAAYDNSMVRENLFNQTDLLYAFETGRVHHTLLAGAEVGRQTTDSLRRSGCFASAPCTASAPSSARVPLAHPIYTGPLSFAGLSSDADHRSVADIAALYVQDQIEFSPQWQLIAGLRYDRFEVDVRSNRTGAVVSSADDLWSPRIGLVWKPSHATSIYASYTTANLPRAGEQLTTLSPSQASLEPEEFRNVEIGAKWDINPDLALTAAAYRLDRRNVFTADPIDNSRSYLVDGQRSEGIELSLSGELTRAWKVLASYAYQEGEILEDIRTSPTSVIPAGTRLAQVPRHSASLWNRYDVSPNWGVGLGATYRGEVFATTSNRVLLDAFTRVDAAVYYTLNPSVQVQLNIENLFDEDYFATAHSDNNLMPGSPRAFYLGVNFKF